MVTAVIALAATPGTATAQVPDTTLGGTLLAQSLLTPPYLDTLQVPLQRRGLYWIAVWPPATGLHVVAIDAHRTVAYALRIREGAGTRPTIIEVHPRTTATHAILISPSQATDTIRISVYSDPKTEAQIQARRERVWGIGLAVAAGYHTGYRIQALEASAKASTDEEGGLLFGSSGRLALLLGAGYDHRYAGAPAVTVVFAEPRLRLARWSLGTRAMTIEICVRAARGSASGVTLDPNYLAAGTLLTYHLDHRPGARGWVVSLELLQGQVGNIVYQGDPDFTRAAIGLSWLP